MNDVLNYSLIKRKRIRLIRQMEVAECGLASLAMIANYHGTDLDLPAIRRRFKPSFRGATLKSIIGVAETLGLASRAVKVPLDNLGDLQLPAILHWDLNHFVVLEKVWRGKGLIHNPDGRSSLMTLAQISKHFTGIALEIWPSERFEQVVDNKRVRLSQLWSKIYGVKASLSQLVILSFVMQIFVLSSPYYMQIAVDSALPALDKNLLFVLALGFGLFTIINSIDTLLRSFVLLSAGAALGYGVSVNLGHRLLRLPVSWFERRHVGDILSKFQSVTPIRQFMTEGAVASILDGVLALFILGLMLFYSLSLSGIIIFALIVFAAMRYMCFSPQRSAQEEMIASMSREQSILIETLRGIITLRLFNRESERQAYWQNRLTEAVNAEIGVGRIAAWQHAADAFIFGTETIVSVWLAISFVIDGGFSVGMAFAYLAYKAQFQQRATSLIDQIISFRMLGLHLERLSDIVLADRDPSFDNEPSVQNNLGGSIELRSVSYRYSPSDPLVLNNVSFVVQPGEHVAITGASGGGKSTLAKILLGLVEPDEGEVIVDGISLKQFGHKNFREQIGAVLQEDNLFAGSLADNVALFDDRPDINGIIAAVKVAGLHEEIMAMPMGYETLVGDMGSSLSGGQKQRLLLARALYRKPKLLLMDEGTSALDPSLEKVVNSAIKELGVTRIVIAHRSETIRAADRILVVRGGRVEEFGE